MKHGAIAAAVMDILSDHREVEWSALADTYVCHCGQALGSGPDVDADWLHQVHVGMLVADAVEQVEA